MKYAIEQLTRLLEWYKINPSEEELKNIPGLEEAIKQLIRSEEQELLEQNSLK